MRSVPAKILEEKLTPPGSLSAHVPRSAISEQIAAASAKLILVRAPAGFGKTTAMAQSRELFETRGIATAWLTLDRADNDVSRFLECLSEVVLRLGVVEPDDAGGLDMSLALAATELPFVLFLDDFEVVHEPAVLSLIREIIAHLPRGSRLVIGSRNLPDIGLGRLRARANLVEIDTDRLRFSLDETHVYFGLHADHPVPAELLLQLHLKTEGWIAAIWLASLAMERHGSDKGFVDRFSGSDRAVADYLAEDVLANQSSEIRDFLLRTSILRQLDASVCQALNPYSNCEAILEQLDAANLFLTPVNGAPRVWRYHSLFADFLRSQLARERPDEITRLHLAASGWYESNDRPVPAIDHAIEGGDYPLALSLLAGRAEQFLDQGRMRTLSRWFSAIPEALLRQHPALQLIAIWAACFTQGPWEALRRLEQSGCAESDIADARSTALAMYPFLYAMQDRYEEAFESGRATLGKSFAGMPFSEASFRNVMSHILSVMGQPHESKRLLDAARSTPGCGAFNRMYSECLEGLADLEEGRLRQATARFRMAVDYTRAVTQNHIHGNAFAGVLYASVVFESNDLVRAKHLLSIYLPVARDIGLADHMILSHVMRSRIAFAEGDVDTASQTLTELEYLGHHRQLTRVVASAKLERSLMLLHQGNALASRDELARAGDAPLWDRERRQHLPAHDLDYLALAKARWEVHFGDPRIALDTLDGEVITASKGNRHRRVLKLRILRALARQRSGDNSHAIDELATVLRAASAEGFARLLLDEGPAVGRMIHHYSLQDKAFESGGRGDPILMEYVQRLLRAFGPVAIDSGAAGAGPNPTDEPLTPKELRVLQLLAEGYSNSAMAEKLFVSDSTVRTHLRNVNMKTGAKSRTQAVAIGRRLGLIR